LKCTKSHVTRKQSGKEQENKGITNCRAEKTVSAKNNQNTAQENKGEKSSKYNTYSTSHQPVTTNTKKQIMKLAVGFLKKSAYQTCFLFEFGESSLVMDNCKRSCHGRQLSHLV
jgi:hypothetical protein